MNGKKILRYTCTSLSPKGGRKSIHSQIFIVPQVEFKRTKGGDLLRVDYIINEMTILKVKKVYS